jgi:superfamily II DNA or RNA helicase
MVLDRIVLVNQTSERLDKYQIDHGVLQSGHWRFRPYEYIQVCSAQTVEKRGSIGQLALLVIDECHTIRKQTADFIKANPHVKVVGLSATPFTKGMGRIYDGIVSTITTKELVDQGVLCPLRVYISKEIDMTGAKKVGGEWTSADASERGMKIVGDVVTEWVSKTHEVFGGPKKTVVFSAGVEHGTELARRFQDAGYKFLCISYRDDDKFKQEIIEEFKKPDSQIQGLIATDILTKGFDVPDTCIGISARPFSKSLSSHIQQMGRVMRGHPGKQFGLWLCFSGNYLRFMDDWNDIYENGVKELNDDKEKSKKEKSDEEKQESKCPQCAALWVSGSKSCQFCGHMRTSPNKVSSVPGELKELQTSTKGERQRFWAMCRYKVAVDGWSKGRASHTFKDKFGMWPNGLDDNQFLSPDQAFDAFVKELLKKFLRKSHAIKAKKK